MVSFLRFFSIHSDVVGVKRQEGNLHHLSMACYNDPEPLTLRVVFFFFLPFFSFKRNLDFFFPDSAGGTQNHGPFFSSLSTSLTEKKFIRLS